LVVLWLLGLVTSYTMGGLVHILLVLAVIMIVVQLIQGRRVWASDLRPNESTTEELLKAVHGEIGRGV
jgi:hypothetical protein